MLARAGYASGSTPILFRCPALLIPWPEMSSQAETLLYWRPAMTLSVGEPELTTITTP
jgi:hypothetical protein